MIFDQRRKNLLKVGSLVILYGSLVILYGLIAVLYYMLAETRIESRGFLDDDAIKYSYVTHSMVERGVPFTPILWNVKKGKEEGYFKKPPLMMWLGAIWSGVSGNGSDAYPYTVLVTGALILALI